MHQSYGVLEFQVEGGPKWIVGERFDVDAKAPAAVDDATVMLMRRRPSAAPCNASVEMLVIDAVERPTEN